MLSGGGFKGAFQVGALNYINEHWKSITGLSSPMHFDIIAGVSVGALNGAMIAMNRLEELNDLWINKIGKNGVSEIYTSDFIDTSSKSDQLKLKIDLKSIAKKLVPKLTVRMNFFRKLGLAFSKKKRDKWIDKILLDIENAVKINFPNLKAIADNTPLKRKLEKLILPELISAKTKFLCGFVSLDTGKYHSVLHDEFSSLEDFRNGILASTAMPMIWNPVDRVSFVKDGIKHTSHNNVDGGIRNVSPLGDVIKLIREDKDSEYTIFIINCSSGKVKKDDYSNKSIASITARSLYDIAITEVFNNDVNEFVKLNKVVKQAKAWDNEISLFDENSKEITSFNHVIINPSEESELGSPLVANETQIINRLLLGHKSCQQYFST